MPRTKKPKNNIYCGINDPKGKKIGTEKECINNNQIRLYGKNKVDENKINESKEYDKQMKILKKIEQIKERNNKLHESFKTMNKSSEKLKATWKKIKENEAEIKKLNKSI